MNWLQRLKLVDHGLTVAGLLLALVLVPQTGHAQNPATLTLRGTFDMDYLQGTVGADLTDVFLQGHDHTWKLTLYGVTFSHEYYGDPNYWYYEWTTHYFATSFDFQIDGPEADTLNAVVSSQLSAGGLAGGAVLELRNGDYWDDTFVIDYVPYHYFNVGLAPAEPTDGVFFASQSAWIPGKFEETQLGYPIATPQLDTNARTLIADQRAGNAGELDSINELLSIDTPLPPPPAVPNLRINDGSVLEGNRQTKTLRLTVTLSGSSAKTVSVSYRTIDGTASSKSDFTAVQQGALTIPPGQISATVAITVKGDRKREPDETFNVQLSNAAGATIVDGVATATILNDD